MHCFVIFDSAYYLFICPKPTKITHNLDFFQVFKIIYNFDIPKVYKNDDNSCLSKDSKTTKDCNLPKVNKN